MIDPGVNYEMVAFFTPQKEGEVFSTLRYETNDPFSPVMLIYLMANGILCENASANIEMNKTFSMDPLFIEDVKHCIDLSEHFVSTVGEELFYNVLNNSEETAKIKTSKEILSMELLQQGDIDFDIIVSDGKCGEFHIEYSATAHVGG